MGIASLWKAPEINPLTGKAYSVPILNPINLYGRVFHLSWLGFFVAFFSWFAWPPLSETLQRDVPMTLLQYQNSNIVGLAATLLVRVIAGPMCDKFGPRYVFIAVLLAGAIPTAFAWGIKDYRGVYAVRFFVGILGGTFVPCQVWMTGFFDPKAVGTANGLAGGWGNAGGGATFFAMPAVYDSLRGYGMSSNKAWRVSFLVLPLIIIVGTAILILIFGEDTPNGPWRERGLRAQAAREAATIEGKPTADGKPEGHYEGKEKYANGGSIEHNNTVDEYEVHQQEHMVVKKPTFKDFLKVFLSLQTILTCLPYACSFGTELAVEGILNRFYLATDRSLGQSRAGAWASMFGLLNVITRPLGGFIADWIFRGTGKVSSKKYWMIILGLLQGIFFLAIGYVNPISITTLIGLMSGLAIFMEAANGANFALVPHIHAQNNGIISGLTGASGNLGGIFFNLVFRYHPNRFHESYYIIGYCVIAANLAVCLIPSPHLGDAEKVALKEEKKKKKFGIF